MPRSGSAQSFKKTMALTTSSMRTTRLQRPMSKYCKSKQRRCKTLGHNASDQMLMAVRTTPSIKHTSIPACIVEEPSSVRTLCCTSSYFIHESMTSINISQCYRLSLTRNEYKRDSLQHGELAGPSSRSLPTELKRSTTTPSLLV